MNLIKKGTLWQFKKEKIGMEYAISDKSLNQLISAGNNFMERALKFSLNESKKNKRKTIVERDALNGIKQAKHSYILDLIEQLEWKLQKMIEKKKDLTKKAL